MRVLLVDDDVEVTEYVRRELEDEGYAVSVSHDGAAGLRAAELQAFDIIVLDVMMPFLDGLEVTRRLRRQHVQTPILLLTARDAPEEIVRGLDSGADDYLTKPFSFDILLARLRAVSRRGAIPQPVCLELANLRLDPATRRATRRKQTLNRTPREFSLLELLLRNSGRVVRRETILESVWGFDCDVNENTLEAFVRLLRLEVDAQEPKLIHTVRGVGYAMREP